MKSKSQSLIPSSSLATLRSIQPSQLKRGRKDEAYDSFVRSFVRSFFPHLTTPRSLPPSPSLPELNREGYPVFRGFGNDGLHRPHVFAVQAYGPQDQVSRAIVREERGKVKRSEYDYVNLFYPSVTIGTYGYRSPTNCGKRREPRERST